MIKITGNLLIINTKDEILIQWCDLPFNLSVSVLWRGFYFHIHINAYNIENGSTRIATIYFNNKKYAYGLTKWKYMGGHHGDYFPVIETSTHKLKFQLALDFLEVKDVSKDSSDKIEQGDNPFVIFYQS